MATIFFTNVVLLHISTEAEVWEWLPFFTNVVLLHISTEAEVWEWLPFFTNVVLLHISTEAEVWEWLPFFINVLTIRPQRALTNIYRKTISHWSHQNWRIHSICGSIPGSIDLVLSTKCITMNVKTPYSRGIISERNPELREIIDKLTIKTLGPLTNMA